MLSVKMAGLNWNKKASSASRAITPIGYRNMSVSCKKGRAL